jgi:hypothetical protein
VDQVHDVGARVHVTSLNVRCSSGDLRPGLNESKGYSALLILVVDTGMDDPQRWLTGVGRYHRSSPLNTMRCSPTASGRRGELVLHTLGWRGRLAMEVHLAPLLGSTCVGSKGSLGSKIGERWRRLLLELVASFNCGENGGRRRATTVARVLGLGILWVKIRAI